MACLSDKIYNFCDNDLFLLDRVAERAEHLGKKAVSGYVMSFFISHWRMRRKAIIFFTSQCLPVKSIMWCIISYESISLTCVSGSKDCNLHYQLLFDYTFKALLSICDSKKRDQRSKIENTRGLIGSLKGDTQNNLTMV